ENPPDCRTEKKRPGESAAEENWGLRPEAKRSLRLTGDGRRQKSSSVQRPASSVQRPASSACYTTVTSSTSQITRLRPACLARYRALSARCSSRSVERRVGIE